jgi:TrmH family RNA methyltransferase
LITSLKNPWVRGVQRLRKRRTRDRSGHFIIEGLRELGRALDGEVRIAEVVVAGQIRPEAQAVVNRSVAAGARQVDVSWSVLESLSVRESPDGVLAIAHVFSYGLEDLDADAHDLFLVVVEIEKPGNLGAMLRTAAATGAAVILADSVTDLLNPSVIRASQGAALAMRVVTATGPDTRAWLDKHGIVSIATSPDATVPVWSADVSGRVAVLIGPEDVGLSDAWLAYADHSVVIPMSDHHGVDSLNASVSAAILLYEATRQRRSPGDD